MKHAAIKKTGHAKEEPVRKWTGKGYLALPTPSSLPADSRLGKQWGGKHKRTNGTE